MDKIPALRKAMGALKDSTTVGLATFNSDFKDLDVAIVKATSHDEFVPKEKHIKMLLAAPSSPTPHKQVSNCMHGLKSRLQKTHNWTVALKTVIVIHRILREGDPLYRDAVLNFSQRSRILQLSNFKDDSSPTALDCSAWIRTYALYLEQRLECFSMLKYDVEMERLIGPRGSEKGYSKTRELGTKELLEQLPALQRLLYRLTECRPEEAAVRNHVVQYALAMVLKESFNIYCAINDGIVNLVAKFFKMPRHEAINAFEIYKRAAQQTGSLSQLYELCRGLEFTRHFHFPDLKEPPKVFFATMEEYIREAPQAISDSTEAVGPSEVQANESAIGEKNLKALQASASTTIDSTTSQDEGFELAEWELALMTAASNSNIPATDSMLAGVLDNLTLGSQYDKAAFRQNQWQQQFYGAPSTNPFMPSDPFASTNPSMASDPFAMSSRVAAPAVQMDAFAQQQAMDQSNPFIQPSHPQHITGVTAANPSGDMVFGTLPANNTPQQKNPFEDP